MRNTAQPNQAQVKRTPRVLACGLLPPPYTGPSVFFAYLVEGLRASGKWEPEVVNTRVKSWRPNQFTAMRFLQTLHYFLSVLAGLPRADVFYLTLAQAWAPFLRDAALIWVAKLFGKPVVVRNEGGAFHLLYQPRRTLFRWFIRATVRRIDRFQVISETIQQSCLAIPGLAERMVVVPDGVDVPAAMEPKRLPGEGRVRILFLSNMMFEKGYADLIEAARILREKQPTLNYCLDFAGEFIADKSFFPSAEAAQGDFWQRVKVAGLEHLVTYHGIVAGPAKERLLQVSHLFALPTYYRYEGSPRSVREALAYALPVIATEWSGLPEMVTSGETGILVPPKQPEALAKALAKVMTDPDLYTRLSQGAYARARRYFSREHHVERMSQIFGDALANRRL